MKKNLLDLKNVKCDLDVIQERIEKLSYTNDWFYDDYYSLEDLNTEKKISYFICGYKEQRIKLDQANTLLRVYKDEFSDVLEELENKIAELDKEGDSNV